MTSQATAEIAALHVGPLITNPKIALAAVVDRADILAAIAEFKRLAFTSAPYESFRSLGHARTWLAGLMAGRRPDPAA